MNKALMEARKQFKGQTGKVNSGFDNSPLPEGNYVCRVTKSEITDDPKHRLVLRVEVGDCKGRFLFPFPPNLSEQEGVISCARNLRAILGEVVPGRKTPSGELEIDFGEFLATVEDLAHQCIDELVEVTVKDSKGKDGQPNLRNDGTPWQSVYVNRGLGDDAASVGKGKPEKGTESEEREPKNTKLPVRHVKRIVKERG